MPPGSMFSASPLRASVAAPSMVVASTEIIPIYQHLSCSGGPQLGTVTWCDDTYLSLSLPFARLPEHFQPLSHVSPSQQPEQHWPEPEC